MPDALTAAIAGHVLKNLGVPGRKLVNLLDDGH
jgi:hypothetical protein